MTVEELQSELAALRARVQADKDAMSQLKHENESLLQRLDFRGPKRTETREWQPRYDASGQPICLCVKKLAILHGYVWPLWPRGPAIVRTGPVVSCVARRARPVRPDIGAGGNLPPLNAKLVYVPSFWC